MSNSVSENRIWRNVPYRVRELFTKYAGAFRAAKAKDPGAAEWHVPTTELGTLTIKNAGAPLKGIANTSLAAQKAMGGPNPLTQMLLEGALGAGLGWGGGWLLKKLMPDYVDEDITHVTTPLGALAGAGRAGFWHAIPNMQHLGWKGLTTPSPFQGGPEYPKIAYDLSFTIEKLAAVMPRLAAYDAMPWRDNYRNGLFVADVNANIWANVVNEDPHIPDPGKALLAGLPMAAASSKGSWLVSPMDVGKVAANAGLGYAYGTAIGSIAGPFLRLTPKARQDIQQAGLLAGAVKALDLV